jgi:AraC-like DNA-binding protein
MIRNRVEAAKSLLRDSDHPVKRIADILGYEDQFFFSRQFHKEVGFSPADFRKRSTG